MSSIEGMDEVLAQLEGLKGEIRERAKKGLEIGLRRIQSDAKALCPVGDGQLRNSIITTIEDDGSAINGAVEATAGHAVYVEMGTGPVGQANHAGVAPVPVTYSPKGWTYMDPKTGEFVHTRGQPAKPYMYPAYKMNKANLLADVADAINE